MRNTMVTIYLYGVSKPVCKIQIHPWKQFLIFSSQYRDFGIYLVKTHLFIDLSLQHNILMYSTNNVSNIHPQETGKHCLIHLILLYYTCYLTICVQISKSYASEEFYRCNIDWNFSVSSDTNLQVLFHDI